MHTEKNRLAYIAECEEQYVIYGCKDEKTLIMMPVKVLEERLNFLEHLGMMMEMLPIGTLSFIKIKMIDGHGCFQDQKVVK